MITARTRGTIALVEFQADSTYCRRELLGQRPGSWIAIRVEVENHNLRIRQPFFSRDSHKPAQQLRFAHPALAVRQEDVWIELAAARRCFFLQDIAHAIAELAALALAANEPIAR